MNAKEQGFLLLTSQLGNPERRPLSAPQLRTLTARVQSMDAPLEDRDLEAGDLTALGYGPEMAQRILSLLSEQEMLGWYLHRARQAGCVPVTRVSPHYPAALRQRLGAEAPGCLWAKGDLTLLERPGIALVGSRDFAPGNRDFALEAGRQAALQGFTLISGNARGADREAQNAALKAGGSVISVVADELQGHSPGPQRLYLAEDDFDVPFSAPRALRRNRIIHCLSPWVLVAQSSLQTGGTWDGTSKNLRFGWSNVYCFDDGSSAANVLEQMGATKIGMADLAKLDLLPKRSATLFDI